MRLHIKEVREAYGKTQEDVSRATGMPISVISRLENGRTRPTLTTLERYADGIGCSLIELVNGPTDSSERDLLVAFRKLSDDDKAAVAALVRRLALA